VIYRCDNFILLLDFNSVFFFLCLFAEKMLENCRSGILKFLVAVKLRFRSNFRLAYYVYYYLNVCLFGR